MMRRTGCGLALAAVLVLSGCATTAAGGRSEQPAAYTEGYDEGCESVQAKGGKAHYTIKKDAYRYRTDALYRDGWDDGYAECRDPRDKY